MVIWGMVYYCFTHIALFPKKSLGFSWEIFGKNWENLIGNNGHLIGIWMNSVE
jgi:hypothetical protein